MAETRTFEERWEAAVSGVRTTAALREVHAGSVPLMRTLAADAKDGASPSEERAENARGAIREAERLTSAAGYFGLDDDDRFAALRTEARALCAEMTGILRTTLADLTPDEGSG